MRKGKGRCAACTICKAKRLRACKGCETVGRPHWRSLKRPSPRTGEPPAPPAAHLPPRLSLQTARPEVLLAALAALLLLVAAPPVLPVLPLSARRPPR